MLVEADYEISEEDRRYNRYSEETDWFKTSCVGDLSRNLDDFRITGTDEYSTRGKQHNPLSDVLVPIIYKEQLEEVVRKFLTEYYPEALNGSVAVNPYTLAERMGLTIKEKIITPDGSMLLCGSFLYTRILDQAMLILFLRGDCQTLIWRC